MFVKNAIGKSLFIVNAHLRNNYQILQLNFYIVSIVDQENNVHPLVV